MNTPTIPEHQVASRIARALKNESQQEVDNSLVRAKLQKQNKYDNNLIIHYTHETRLNNNKRHIHQLWNQIFTQTPILSTRLIVGTRNNHNIIQELVHQKPRSLRSTDNHKFHQDDNNTNKAAPNM